MVAAFCPPRLRLRANEQAQKAQRVIIPYRIDDPKLQHKPRVRLQQPEALYDWFTNKLLIKCFCPELSRMITIGEVHGGFYAMPDGRIFFWDEGEQRCHA